MKIAVANPSVAPYVKQTAIAYYEADFLQKFYATFLEHPDYRLSRSLQKWFPFITQEINRRSFHDIPFNLVKTRPFPELFRSISARKFGPLITDKIWEWAEKGFDKWVADSLDQSLDAIHVYEHASLETIKRAKDLGIFTIYEQPSQHHSFFTNVANKQLQLYPELASAATNLLIDDEAKRRNKRRDEELALADLIYCNSSFTKKTLTEAGISDNRITVLPYGFPPVQYQKSDKVDGPVIFLNAGSQNLRKALHLLYKAWSICNFPAAEAELWLIGKMGLPASLRENLPGKVVIKENIPHEELMNVYKRADVFVLPTLADGFGMVISEAMSRGVPVISTENSGGPDIINHMKDGWIIPAGDINAIVEQMKWCVNNKNNLNDFSKAAIEKAAGWQWSDYRLQLPKMISNAFENKRR